jgi:hypothetical protein
MSLINPAHTLVAELLKGVNLKQEKYVNQILRQGYQEYCNRVQYGNTSSGYKAWRKACRVATGKQPARKASKKHEKKFNDPDQMELF